jgi:hypothetical protein
LCGKELTKAGLIGHMRFKHGKDYKAPLLSVEKPMQVGEARLKAKAYDNLSKLFDQVNEIVSPCCHALLISVRQVYDPDNAAKLKTEFFKCEKCGKLWKASRHEGFYLAADKPIRRDSIGRMYCEDGGLMNWVDLNPASRLP